MPDRRRILAAIALAAAAVTAPWTAHAEGPGAREVVVRLYDLHAARSDGAPQLWEDPATRDALFSPDLLTAFDRLAEWQSANPDDVPPLNGDPFWDAQDWEIANLAIGDPETIEDGLAAVEVSFQNFGDARLLHYKVVETPAGWRIDDIGYDHGAGGYALRDLLAAE